MTDVHAANMNGGAVRPRVYDPAPAWPEPDSNLTNGGARPAPAFPIDTLGALGSYAADFAASKGAPVDYFAAPLLAFAAGAVGAARKVLIRPGWEEHAILWVASVGAPSCGKSPPLLALKRALAAIERESAGDVAERRREHEAAKAEAGLRREEWERSVAEAVKHKRAAPPMPAEAEEPEEPRIPRMIVADVTTEKLARIIAENPRGVISIRDELAGLLGNFGKYGGEDAPFYLSAYNSDFSPVDRVKGGTITAARANLCVVGSTQPDKIQGLLSGRANDGLVSRFLMVWPDAARRVWEVPTVDEGRLVALFRRLRSLEMDTEDTGELAPRVIPLAPEAAQIFAAWWKEQGAKAAESAGFMAEFLGKSDGTCARVALVLELLDWAAASGGDRDGPRAVSAGAVERACRLFADYFEPMAARVYADAGLPEAERKAVLLLKEIRRRGARRFNLTKVYRGADSWRLPGLTQSADVEAACAVLIEGDCIREAERDPSAAHRPKKDYLVNPRLFGGAA
ncbi:MAG TPA: DUF3987 domain-containing protein [Vitreimonas sp.]|uniref:DUF3987 domain-containing protein n=1 Tax=Vitreimonas sp. TaxID=3069702 RepID=UPI002D2B6D54|nr:DUF3987 domain-containing protein [Vitreimonas sp.]HYD86789.1 DUF3987 domain-containing protein [Vitreimonas sp.]